jgi:hypothetical protein
MSNERRLWYPHADRSARSTHALTLGLAVVAASLAAVPSPAHHSAVGRYDQTSMLEIEGEITDVRWHSPHVRLTLRSVNDAGEQVAVWEIEGAAPSNLARTGVTADSFRVDDHVRLAGWPPVGDRKEMFMQNALLPSGEELLMWVTASPRWSEKLRGDFAHWRQTEGDPSRPELGLFRVWSSSLALPLLFDLGSRNVDGFPLTVAAQEAVRAYADAETNLATQGCVPKGMPLIMEQPYPMEFVRDGDEIVLRMEEYDAVRTIHMGEETAAAAGRPRSSFGYSVGRWEGRTLVVTTTRLNWPWFNQQGIPQSEDAVLIERFTPSADGSLLDYELTATDAATFTEPVTRRKQWLYLPDQQVRPYECEATTE